MSACRAGAENRTRAEIFLENISEIRPIVSSCSWVRVYGQTFVVRSPVVGSKRFDLIPPGLSHGKMELL